MTQDPFAEPKFLLASSLDPVEEVLVARNPLTARFAEALAALLPQTGARLTFIDSDGPPADVWIQDAVEIGRLCRRTLQGRERQTAALPGLRALHDPQNPWTEPLDRAAREHLAGRGAVILPAGEPRPGTRWIDWFGNLEVSPPVSSRSGREFPHGRLPTGRQNSLTMHPGVLEFLERQGVQTPPLVLQYNAQYRVTLMNTFLAHFHEPFFREKMPLCLKNAGASIWIQKE